MPPSRTAPAADSGSAQRQHDAAFLLTKLYPLQQVGAIALEEPNKLQMRTIVTAMIPNLTQKEFDSAAQSAFSIDQKAADQRKWHPQRKEEQVTRLRLGLGQKTTQGAFVCLQPAFEGEAERGRFLGLLRVVLTPGRTAAELSPAEYEQLYEAGKKVTPIAEKRKTPATGTKRGAAEAGVDIAAQLAAAQQQIAEMQAQQKKQAGTPQHKAGRSESSPAFMRLKVEFGNQEACFQARADPTRTQLDVKCLRKWPGTEGGGHALSDEAVITLDVCEALNDPEVRLVDPKDFTPSWDSTARLHTLSWSIVNKDEDDVCQWSTPRSSSR